MQDKKQWLKAEVELYTGFKLEKEYIKVAYCHPAYWTSMQSTSCEKLGWMTSWNQDCWEKCQQLQIRRWYHPKGREWRGTKEPLDEGEWGEWKNWLKTQHSKNEDHGVQSHHFMANRRGKIETMIDFIFLGSKITVDGDCSHEIKRCLLLGRKAMTNLDSILKNRDITCRERSLESKLLLFP